MEKKLRRLAVLIDGDFVKPKFLGRVLAEAGRRGTIGIRRIYGDEVKMSKWAECIDRHGITTVPNYAKGRNAADITLIIDAVDMLRSGKADGFCIVASDNHFAGLAGRIRKKGIYIMGIGSLKNKPSAFKEKCDDFKYVDDLPLSDNPDPAAQKVLSDWKGDVKNAILKSAPDGGWVLLSKVGDNLKVAGVSIKPRYYCHGRKPSLFDSCLEFEVKDNRVRLLTSDSS